MKSGGTFILGGLLQGLGKGVTNMHEERRQSALLKLKREWEVADQATAATAAEAARVQALEDKKELLNVGAAADLEKATVAANLARAGKKEDQAFTLQRDQILADLALKKDRASKALEAEIQGGQVQGIATAEDGSMLVTYKDGTVRKRDIKLRDTRAKPDEDDAPTISGARGERGKPAVAKPDTPVATGLGALPPPPDGQAGRTMTGPGGKKAYWNGRTWVLMTPGNAAEQRRLLNGG